MIKFFNGENSFLSNFYPCLIEYQGISYQSVEHFYVAMKITDLDIRLEISKVKTAGDVKKMSRSLKLRSDWEDVKIQTMRFALDQKFSYPELKDKLLATSGDIIEGNWWHDNTWGICYCESCPGIGKNILGKMLMDIRDVKKG